MPTFTTTTQRNSESVQDAKFVVQAMSCRHVPSLTVKKVDKRLIPMLASLYLVSHLDRANIGNTKIEGIDKDLGIDGIQWNIVLSL